MQSSSLKQDGKIDPAQAQSALTNITTPNSGLGFLDQLGQVSVSLIGAAGASLIDREFGLPDKDVGAPSRRLTEDDTDVLGDALVTQNNNQSTMFNNKVLLVGGGLLGIALLVYAMKK